MFQTPANDPTPKEISKELKKLDPQSVEFHESLLFVNRTQRFSLPIPDLGDAGEPLVYPAISDRAGEIIKEREDGTPDTGIVFYNTTDGIWQGVRAHGEGVLIINDIDAITAERLMSKITSLNADVDKLSLSDFKEIIQFIQEDLDISDIFPSERSSIEKNTKAHEAMPVPLDSSGEPRHDFGYRTVNKDTLHQGALISEGFIFDDKRGQRYTDGAVVLTDGKFRWCVALDVFQRSFKKLVDGNEVALGSLEEEFAN